MVLRCTIEFENQPEGIYKPGGKVVGSVDYFIGRDKLFESLTVSLKGRASCYWSSKAIRLGLPRRYYGNQQLVSMHEEILAESTGTIIKAGLYKSFFEFQLPDTLPPSSYYKGCDCKASIKYFVRLKSSEPGLLTKAKRFKFEIIVGTFLKPTLPEEPRMFTIRKEVYKWYGVKNGSVGMKVTIGSSVIRPGDIIDLHLEIENKSNNSIDKILIILIEMIMLTSDIGKAINTHRKIKGYIVQTDKIEINKTINVMASIVSPHHAANIQDSTVISRGYKLIVTAMGEGYGLYKDARIIIPIQIGEIKNTPNRN